MGILAILSKAAVNALRQRIDAKIARLQKQLTTLQSRLDKITSLYPDLSDEDAKNVNELIGQSEAAGQRFDNSPGSTDVSDVNAPSNPYAFENAPKDARYVFRGDVAVEGPDGRLIKVISVDCTVYGSPTVDDVRQCIEEGAEDRFDDSPDQFGVSNSGALTYRLLKTQLIWKNF